MRMKLRVIVLVLTGVLLAAAPASATPINFYLGVDDHGSLTINGTTYISLSCLGSCSSTVPVNLPGGWYPIVITYANYGGSTNLFFDEDYTLGGTLQPVSKTWLRSLDASGSYIQGLRADYYSAVNFTGYLGTVYGEGPIAAGYNTGFPYTYQNQLNTSGFGWGPYIADAGWSTFSETLSGELYVPAAVPEPASLLLLGTGLIGLAARARHKRSAHRSAVQ